MFFFLVQVRGALVPQVLLRIISQFLCLARKSAVTSLSIGAVGNCLVALLVKGAILFYFAVGFLVGVGSCVTLCCMCGTVSIIA